ncbi:MAG: hypothetical protein MUO22_03925 [Sedimentisphaerales bacterium]|nr:hypothetical protein [Sedimentisphaerales bacterium]
MAKSAGRKTGGKTSTKKKKGIVSSKSNTKTAEYVKNLLELHKLQGTLLNRLKKEL